MPLFGRLVPSVHVDATSVRDSVSFAIPKKPEPPLLDAKARKPNVGLFVGKVDTVAKEKFNLDPMMGLTP